MVLAVITASAKPKMPMVKPMTAKHTMRDVR